MSINRLVATRLGVSQEVNSTTVKGPAFHGLNPRHRLWARSGQNRNLPQQLPLLQYYLKVDGGRRIAFTVRTLPLIQFAGPVMLQQVRPCIVALSVQQQKSGGMRNAPSGYSAPLRSNHTTRFSTKAYRGALLAPRQYRSPSVGSVRYQLMAHLLVAKHIPTEQCAAYFHVRNELAGLSLWPMARLRYGGNLAPSRSTTPA